MISADDVRDLRLRLDEALTALGIQTSSYDDSILAGAPNGTLIRKTNINQLRLRATSGVGGSGGGGSSTISIQWLVSDQLGTPRMVFDQTGAWLMSSIMIIYPLVRSYIRRKGYEALLSDTVPITLGRSAPVHPKRTGH